MDYVSAPVSLWDGLCLCTVSHWDGLGLCTMCPVTPSFYTVQATDSMYDHTKRNYTIPAWLLSRWMLWTDLCLSLSPLCFISIFSYCIRSWCYSTLTLTRQCVSACACLSVNKIMLTVQSLYTIIIMEICKAPTLRLKALNKHNTTHIIYNIEMENFISNLTKS